MTPSDRKHDFALLVEFVLAQAEHAPLPTRVPVYRALSNLLGDNAASLQLAQIADELQHIDEQYRSFEFMLQNPPPPAPLPPEPSGNGQPQS